MVCKKIKSIFTKGKIHDHTHPTTTTPMSKVEHAKSKENSNLEKSVPSSKDQALNDHANKTSDQSSPYNSGASSISLNSSTIYIPISYVLSCILASINFIILNAWIFFFYSLKNNWKDITEAIAGYVTGLDLPYSWMIWVSLWVVWMYLALLVIFHPIRKFWISSWRPRNSSVRNIHIARIRMSMGWIHILLNLLISIITITIAPILIWQFAPQLAIAPVRLLETILPPIFLIAQCLYSAAGLPALIFWSSAISKASRVHPYERSPPCTISLRGIRVLSLLTIGATILWGGAIFFSSLPLWFDSAHFLSGEDLPPKPKLFAHRGLTEHGHPENSLSSFRAALEHSDVFGIETDISISFDGIPFCLHDKLLLRTTNIKSVFPDKYNQPAESFSMEDLEKLTLIGSGNSEKIPTFKAVLEELVKFQDKRLIFDLRTPSTDGHPFTDKHQDLIRSVIESIPNVSNQIVLLNLGPTLEKAFPTSPTATNYELSDLLSKDGVDAKKKAEAVKEGDTSSTNALPAPSSRGLNVEYLIPTQSIRKVRGLSPPTRSLKAWKHGWSQLIKEVKASMSSSESAEDSSNQPKPFWMCMYALSEPHLYSQAWCLGVDAVIADSVETFSSMNEPVWWVPKSKMYFYPLIGFVGGALFLLWTLIFLLLKIFDCLSALISCVMSIFCCCSRSQRTKRKTGCCFLGSAV